MKDLKTFRAVCLSVVFFLAASVLSAEDKPVSTPFTRGVNMTSWFEAWSPGQGNLTYYDRSDIEQVKSLGADVIRLPVHFDNLSSGAPDYKVNELTWKYLDKVVDWCEEMHIYLVIDDHSFNSGPYPSPKEVENHLQKVWPQIASRYSGRSRYVIYEILNEPNHIDAAVWNKIQGKALKTIRSYDKKHTVVITGADWGSIRALDSVQLYNDSNLIYTFHFYSPFVFTHQGASWTSKEEEALSAIPFPYNKARMPPVPEKVKGTWMEEELLSKYPVNGTEGALRKELTSAASFGRKNNVPVWCGELGVYDRHSLPEDRVRWYETTGALLRELHIPLTVWGYGGGFGLFRKNTHEIYPGDLDPAVLAALGFTVPEKAGTPVPEEAIQMKIPFEIFDDFPRKRIEMNVWEDSRKKKTTLTACTENPAEGLYCIRWGNSRQYESLNFMFNTYEDLSAVYENVAVSFKMRTTNPAQVFDVRFVNRENDRMKPWRMSYTVHTKDYAADGKWHTVTIPVSSMKETGAWSQMDNKWYDGEGLFDWHNVYILQFSAEQGAVSGDIFLDDIKITAE